MQKKVGFDAECSVLNLIPALILILCIHTLRSCSCNCRWYTYLNSDFKKGGWSPEEDILLCEVGNQIYLDVNGV